MILLIAFSAGIWADQTFPDIIPVLAPGRSPGRVDQATLNQAQRLVQAQYYDPKVDSTKLTEGSIRGLVTSLGDPFSRYLTPQEFKDQQAGIAGRHTGAIGIFVAFEGGRPVVTGLLPGSPALAAGLRTGDVILAVSGHDTDGLGADQTAALIQGPAGTSIKLHIRRGLAEQDVTVERSNFQSPTVVSHQLAGGILYIRIYQFGDATQKEFDQALAESLPGSNAVILDLRDNGGGLVDAAASVISRFVASGEAFSRRGRDGRDQVTNVDGNHPAATEPLAVLVNANTASASEIVSGSLQAHHRAELVGVRTFGKGSVQVDFQLRDGSVLHLTVEHWFLPDGRSINGVGIPPDVSVALPDPAAMFDVVQPQLGEAGDAQLAAAISLVQSGRP
ncbi:MAG: S41 family peptidase [Candidatus Dormibacteraeota bacterium]|nr:S41 family peptidase [Candidatus Dormibacteraeota bacterium]